MLKQSLCGMVSVTFRRYSVDEVIQATKKAGLAGIEWGGDIHVPHGDLERARYTAERMAEAGLTSFSYGSYYRAAASRDFEAVLETAVALGAPNIRIWAGPKGSTDTDEALRAAVVTDVQRCADLAAEKKLTISFECHGGTLTDCPDSAVRLMEEIHRPNVVHYWQPNQFKDLEYNIAGLKKMLPYVTSVHVFTWNGGTKLPLIDGEERWRAFLDILASDGREHGLYLEFSPDDTEETFASDAETLINWVKERC